MRFLAGVVTTLVVLAAIGFVYMYAGVFDVSALRPHTGVGRWILETTLERSVASRAPDQGSRQLTAAQAHEGFHEFDSVCSTCHGGPGIKPAEWTKGMRPQPPDLSKAVKEWSDGELFWIVKNGIKMSGMPAQAKDESDEDIWNIVAFLRTLPNLSASDYARMKAGAGGGEKEAS